MLPAQIPNLSRHLIKFWNSISYTKIDLLMVDNCKKKFFFRGFNALVAE